MKISRAAFSTCLGLSALPQSVKSFSLGNERPNCTTGRCALTTELRSTLGDVTPTKSKAQSAFKSAAPMSADSVPATEEPAPLKTFIRTKNRKSPRRPNKDINFLVKRTNQLISHAAANADDESSEEANIKFEEKVSIQTFHWLIDAWTESHHPTAPEHSLSLVNIMKEYNIKPTSKTITKVILAFAKCGRGGDKSKEVLDFILNEHASDDALRPNSYSYTAVLEAYAGADVCSVKDATMAEKLMELMIDAAKDGDESMRPNSKSFLALIRTWGSVWDSSHNGIEIGPIKAERCLTRMRQLHDDNIIKEPPNVYHHNAILNAWANSGEEGSAERAESLLLEMEKGIDGVKPNTVSYNICIDAYAKEGNGEMAEALLNRMDEFFLRRENRDCKPNTRSFNSVMNAYAKSSEIHACSKAETILRKMQSLYTESEETDLDIKPDFVSFATVINAWGRSFEYSKAAKVLSLYREMVSSYQNGDLSLRPNVVIFNSIMNACAYTVGDASEERQAMEIAKEMLKELEKSSYAKADQITYGTFLKVCENQMPQSETRNQLIDLIFQRCKRDGQMGQLVLDQLKSVTTTSQFEELLGSNSSMTSWMELPKEWTRNVVEGKRFRRQMLLNAH